MLMLEEPKKAVNEAWKQPQNNNSSSNNKSSVSSSASSRIFRTCSVQLKYFSAESPPSCRFLMLYTRYLVTSPKERP